MARNAQKPLQVLLLTFGTLGLIVLLFVNLVRKKSPAQVITEVLSQKGLSQQIIKFWIAVSAFETAYQGMPWNSPVLRDTRNLFNIIVPGSTRLQRGEGQTIYNTWKDSVEGLYDHVLKPFKYPAHVETIEDLVNIMKQKGFFTANKDTYLTGVKFWYNKFYSA